MTCAKRPDDPVIVCHHPIPIPRLASGYPPPWLVYHDDDFTTHIFDIGEHCGEVYFSCTYLHHREYGTNTSPPIFPVPPTS